MDGPTTSDPLHLLSTGASLSTLAGAVMANLSEAGLALSVAVLISDETGHDLMPIGSGDPGDRPTEPDEDTRALAARTMGSAELLVSPFDADLGSGRGLMAAAPIFSPGGGPCGAVVARGDEIDFDQATLALVMASAHMLSIAIVNERVRGTDGSRHGRDNTIDRIRLAQVLSEVASSRAWGSRVAVLVVGVDSDPSLSRHEAMSILASAVRPTDLVADLDDDSFVVVCPHLAHNEDTVALVRRIDVRLGGTAAPLLRLGAFTVDCPAPDVDLVAEARANPIVGTFDDTPTTTAPMTAPRVLRAIGQGAIEAHYQPLARAEDCHIVGVEALARWGAVPPLEFVEILEASGDVHHLTSWMLQTACRDVAGWLADGEVEPCFYVSVNVSASELTSDSIVTRVADALADSGLRPANLCIEITETAALSDRDRSGPVLAAMRDLGVRIAIDDFGTGYASFASLRHVPAAILKIDRSLVYGLPDPHNMAMVQAVSELARAFGFIVVAEGVETEIELRALAELDVDVIQGYLVSRPLPAADLLGLVRDRSIVGAGRRP